MREIPAINQSVNMSKHHLHTEVGYGMNPYSDPTQGSALGSGTRSLHRSESDEALEKWNQVFNVQKSRWQSEFDKIKKRFTKKVD